MDKKLRYIDVLGLVIGAIIGWGSFTLPGTKFLREAGVINTFIGLLIGGIFIMVIQNGYHIMLENHRWWRIHLCFKSSRYRTWLCSRLVLKSLLFKHGTAECRSLCVTAS